MHILSMGFPQIRSLRPTYPKTHAYVHLICNFRKFDRHKTGFVTAADIVRVSASMQQPISQEDVRFYILYIRVSHCNENFEFHDAKLDWGAFMDEYYG